MCKVTMSSHATSKLCPRLYMSLLWDAHRGQPVETVLLFSRLHWSEQPASYTPDTQHSAEYARSLLRKDMQGQSWVHIVHDPSGAAMLDRGHIVQTVLLLSRLH